MQIPDVVGYTLCEAREILNVHKINISGIKTATTPKDSSQDYNDSYRVLRMEILGDSDVELLICKPL